MDQPVLHPTLALLAKTRVLPIVVIHEVDIAVSLGQALLRAGMDMIEITFRTPAAAEAVYQLTQHCPQLIVGAGTLLTPAQVDSAVVAGARFGVAPGTNPQVIQQAASRGLPFIPGIATPSELERALTLGCSVVKFFPAAAAGGLPMLKAMLAAYRHTGVRFVPTGGIDAEALLNWLALPEVIAVGGSWMVDQALLKQKNWDEVVCRTRQALDSIRGLS